MQIIRKRAYARAGVVGNPSDGYHGRTISVIVKNFWAQVTLYEWDEIELVPSQEDQSRFRSIHELVRDVQLHGYYGGLRLVKGTIRKFAEYCYRQGHRLHERNFSIRYESTIPRQVGLAGSSAIIVATLRCLMEFYGVEIPQHVLPSLALSVETEELGIAAGLQDRVIQVYEGMVYMDFTREKMRWERGLWCGQYEPMDPGLLPPVYLAYSVETSEPTEVVHNNLRARYEQGEPKVIQTMEALSALTLEAREAILRRDAERLGQLINRNYDLRETICKIALRHAEMVRRAREVGASAHFAGSGGAILGTYTDQAMYERLEAAMEKIHCRLLRPIIV